MTALPIEQLNPQEIAAELVVAVHDADVLATHRALRDLDMEGLRLVVSFLASCLDPDRPLVPSTAVRLAPDDLVGLVATHAAAVFGVTASDVFGRSRQRPIRQARFVTCTVAVRLGLSRAQVGRTMGRDHTTVMYALEQVAVDEVLDAVTDRLVSRLVSRVFL